MIGLRRIILKIFGFKKMLGGGRVDYMYGEALPKPMTAEEEKEALLKMSQGDESARQTLIERNLRLVVYIAKKY